MEPPQEILDRLIEIIKASYRENGAMLRCQERDAEGKRFLLRNYLIYYSGEHSGNIERLYKSCENCTNRQNAYLQNLKRHLKI